jgi:hypothetical protein
MPEHLKELERHSIRASWIPHIVRDIMDEIE